jgi:hypothetical protein
MKKLTVLFIGVLLGNINLIAQGSFADYYSSYSKAVMGKGLQYEYRYQYYASLKSISSVQDMKGKYIAFAPYYYNQMDYLVTVASPELILIADNRHKVLMIDSNREGRKTGQLRSTFAIDSLVAGIKSSKLILNSDNRISFRVELNDSDGMIQSFDCTFDKTSFFIEEMALYFNPSFPDSYTDEEDEDIVGSAKGEKSKLVIAYSGYKVLQTEKEADLIGKYVRISGDKILPGDAYDSYTFINHLAR